MSQWPQSLSTDRYGDPRGPVAVDNVWASPSTLHMRVTVWGPQFRYRKKYDIAVPLDDIPREALAAIWQHFEEETYDADNLQDPLF